MWEKEELYFNTSQYFESVIRYIDNAKSSVDVEMYIFNLDTLGTKILDALIRASERGVRVRLIIDGLGSSDWSSQQIRHLAEQNVFVRVYHPLPPPFSRLFSRRLIKPSTAFRLLRRINKRTHKKQFIIDGSRAFVGSMNISDEHKGWRETSVHVEGPELVFLEKSYESTWDRSYNPNRKEAKRILVTGSKMEFTTEGLVRTNITRKQRQKINRDLLARIKKAEKRVWLTSAYFVPSPRIIRHLTIAAKAGVEVRLLLPRQSDVRIVRWVSMLLYQSLLNAGITIYEYLPSMLHAKTLIVDDWVSIGTSNLNHRSIYHDLEVDIVLNQKNSIGQLVRQFTSDVANSDCVTQDWLKTRPVLTWIAAYLGSMLRWWM